MLNYLRKRSSYVLVQLSIRGKHHQRNNNKQFAPTIKFNNNPQRKFHIVGILNDSTSETNGGVVL